MSNLLEDSLILENAETLETSFDIRAFQGLFPKHWLCVDRGYSREEVKDFFLKRGIGFSGEVITTPSLLCSQILSHSGIKVDSDQILNSLARQEVLRALLNHPSIQGRFTELRRLKRKKNFLEKLDRSLQAGRLLYCHAGEQEIQQQLLNDTLGERLSRQEFAQLALILESWYEQVHCWDEPLLLRKTLEVLQEHGWPPSLDTPEKILHLRIGMLETLEQAFWETVSGFVNVEKKNPTPEIEKREWNWEKWHTLDDAVERMADELSENPSHAVLIPDQPAVRRCLRRVFTERGLSLADPQDPTALLREERLKKAWLGVRVVTENFNVQAVETYIKGYLSFHPRWMQWIQEIYSRGVRERLNSYRGGTLVDLVPYLEELKTYFGGKRLISEFTESHLKWLGDKWVSQWRKDSSFEKQESEMLRLIQTVWQAFQKDCERIGEGSKKAPLLYWVDRIFQRQRQMSQEVSGLKPTEGILLYRFSQAPVAATAWESHSSQKTFEKLWIVGLDTAGFSGSLIQDFWFTERDRRALSKDFPVRCSVQIREERLQRLKLWIENSKEVVLLDTQYLWDGREREISTELVRELAGFEVLPQMKASRLRWKASYQPPQGIPQQKVQLKSLRSFGKFQAEATELDRYSRCGFQALGSYRWRLQDLREPGLEPWPEVRGSVLHRALEILLRSRRTDGTFDCTPSEALEEAWQAKKVKGIFQGEEIRAWAQKFFLRILMTFCEKEAAYAKRSGSSIFVLEPTEPVVLEFPEGKVVGVPDRIDETKDGLFVIDYKGSSFLPSGRRMVEDGYRLQLPFYAVAVEERFGKPVTGAQFVQLTLRGERNKGILFKNYNGKEPGKLTDIRSRENLFEEPREAVWERVRLQLRQHLIAYLDGFYEASPKDVQECRSCVYKDACGRRRWRDSDSLGDLVEGSGGEKAGGVTG